MPHATRSPFLTSTARLSAAGSILAGSRVTTTSPSFGDAHSTWRDGIVSVANRAARALGARAGLRAKEVIDRWALGG